jgi:hypothetical protein
MAERFTFRSRNADGTINEIELTPEQALDLAAGQPIGYAPHDKQILVDDDGTIIHRESAVPRTDED